MLNDLLNERRASLPERIDLGLWTAEQIKMADTLFSKMKIWLLVTSDEEKAIILSETKDVEFSYRLEVFSQNDIRRELNMGSEDGS